MSDQDIREHLAWRAKQQRERDKAVLVKARLNEAEAALRAVEDQANKWIGDCCGHRAGDRFCEHFGCITIRELIAPARAHFEKWSGK